MGLPLKHLTINLEHDIDEHYQYQPGEIVRGSVTVCLTRSALLRSITISILGEGRVCWEDNVQQNQASEIYMDASKLIFDTRNTKPLNLNDGTHQFPFEYQLPNNLPSSYIGKYGNVTYVLKAIIVGGRVGESSITSEPFLVVRPSPLSTELLRPVNMVAQKKVWKMCSFGKIVANISINKSGLVPGEDILIDANITNRSPKVINAIQAALLMNSSFYAQKKTISFRQIVNKRRDEYEMGYAEGRKWRNVRLAVPPYIPESNLDFCDLIEVSYAFQFRVEVSGGSDIRMETPLTVGTKPLGLEVPGNAEEREKARWYNTRWTGTTERNYLGSEMLNREDEIQSELDRKTNSWHVGGAEITQEERQMVNPLFELNEEAEAPPEPEIMENTRL